MVKRLVLWKVREDLVGHERDEALQKIKRGFEALPGRIPGLLKLEIGISFNSGELASGLALYAEFASREALAAYDTHPEHQALVPLVLGVRTEKRSADYEL